jgi:hypothetical protein
MQMLVEGTAMGALRMASSTTAIRWPEAVRLVMTDRLPHKFGKIWADRTST